MAALTSQSGSLGGVVPTPVAAGSSDTIAESQFGPNGVQLRVINGNASADNVSISDPGVTAIGNPGTVTPAAVAGTTTRVFNIPRSAINPSSGVVTIAHSVTATVTQEVWRY